MSGRVVDHGHRARQARWYRGGDIVLVQWQAERDEGSTVTIYPKASGMSVEHAGVPSRPDFPRLEEQVLAYWKSDDTFNVSVERNQTGDAGGNEFVFYDGPPFANGLPHYGHLLTGYVKDIVPRYQTMRGRRVERRFGWDCHGLPAELEAMAQLGLKTKSDIENLGISKFNQACRE
jgi:isoleucyl-tRNA synthetase